MSAPEKTGKIGKGNPPVEHRFKPGNPGRPKGARNKLGEAFIAALHDDFTEHGVAVIQTVRADKPDQYLKVIASLLPKEMNLNVTDTYSEMSDDELIERIRDLSASFAPLLAGGNGGVAERLESAAGEGQSPKVH
ncbi:hypothetical protein [Sphingorhabdus sp. SMR4y]|uniref:hypothetical protein n=1 Tax=Sphingorhabdus sp. SMR4y TaxID=2584094 RepID=UPI000B5E094F|nr:hypothetical protein [Sphingorhabdus sp. SMR4y]ASK88471.1 hypothetical protein SPHFLASMR4Y_01724 [Sphingorhabdus sp. SMR4y]